jgi:hypothetical protein
MFHSPESAPRWIAVGANPRLVQQLVKLELSAIRQTMALPEYGVERFGVELHHEQLRT